MACSGGQLQCTPVKFTTEGNFTLNNFKFDNKNVNYILNGDFSDDFSHLCVEITQ